MRSGRIPRPTSACGRGRAIPRYPQGGECMMVTLPGTAASSYFVEGGPDDRVIRFLEKIGTGIIELRRKEYQLPLPHLSGNEHRRAFGLKKARWFGAGRSARTTDDRVGAQFLSIVKELIEIDACVSTVSGAPLTPISGNSWFRIGALDSHANLVLLYLSKGDGSESMLYERFGVELLVVPLKRPEIAGMPLATGNQRRRAVNALVREGSRAIRHAQDLLAVNDNVRTEK